ncbi:hypothetical protein [Flavobacterium oreochromis]|uniref:Sensor histidine kinase n=1 Tax=Flavobacterium oreochromis TaxID=2906078 RepID=A0ABW8P865_9FLAO|nr:hypothetical protein [Flavobacterium oreochromis]
MNQQIEVFLEKNLEINKTYKIYNGIIKVINSINIIIGFRPNISQIVCFKLIDNSVYLENSSHFIWSYTINEDEINLLKKSRKTDSYLEKIQLTINGSQIDNNFFIFNSTKSNEYLFIFISETPLNNKFGIIYLKQILFSVTNRISRVIGTENDLKSEKKNMLNSFRNKYFQIQNSEKAMHFIRNRFNTLDNFIEMSKDNINGNMDDEDMSIYKAELYRVERNYKMLMDRVKSILNKTDKPFSATNLENKSINHIFDLIRDVWYDYFKEFNPTIDINFHLNEKMTVKINPEGFYILISDWISNISKYSKGSNSIHLEEDENSFKITFKNAFSNDSKLNIESLMNDFNSNERDKILQRTSHGILIMKSILEEMNVKGCIEIENGFLKLILTLKKEIYENSHI